MRIRRILVLVLIGVLIIAVAGGVVFVNTWSNPMPAQTAALAAMQSTPDVAVTDGSDQISFIPTSGTPKAGLIFYQGARVAPAAYALTMHAIAAQGYAVFVPKLPLNLALLGINAADGIIAAHPQITRWALGGHSLGGVAAAVYASAGTHPTVRGLLFYASYPASSMAANTTLAITSISATLDGLATPQKIADAKSLLPASTNYVIIQGGDHGQFGDYGPQDGDNPATISLQAQTDQVVAASVDLLKRIAA